MILKICLLVAIIIYFSVINNLVIKDKIYLKYALLWYLLGVLFIVFTIFPNLLSLIMRLIGINDPLNGLFAFLFFFLFLVIITLLATISRLNTSNKKLVQKVAILDKEIKELKEKI